VTVQKPPVRVFRLVGPAILTLAAVSIFLGLGFWQLRRLAWKEALIAAIETRADAPAQPLPGISDWPNLRPDDYDYRHVTARGFFENDKETLLFRPSGGAGLPEPGYHVLTPLRLNTGGYVIVNRGYVPPERKDKQIRVAGLLSGEAIVTGLLRQPETRNLFTPPDDPAAALYFTRDPVAIGKRFALAPLAPFTIDADDEPIPGGWPRGGTTIRQFPNNHLSYALTWFGLALMLLAAVTIVAWKKN